VRAVDLQAVTVRSGHVLIQPITGRGRLALEQLLDASMPRVGDALLLHPEQESAVCGFLRALPLSLRRWSFQWPLASSGDHCATAEGSIPTPAISRPSGVSAPIAANWRAMSKRRWLALQSILRLPPGGERIVIALPAARGHATRGSAARGHATRGHATRGSATAGTATAVLCGHWPREQAGQLGGPTQRCTALVPCSIPMSTISIPPPQEASAAAAPEQACNSSSLAAPLPAWVVPATPEIERTVVGISPNGDLYIYGDSPDRPGPLVPAIVGVVSDLRVSQHGINSRYGLRDYLDLHLATPLPAMEVILRLPCKANPQPGGGEPLIPWSVRSLLGALQVIDLSDTALKLQTRRGNSATFFRVLPYSASGIEQAEIRAVAIGGSRDDLEIAVNHLRGQLDRPPFFPAPASQHG